MLNQPHSAHAMAPLLDTCTSLPVWSYEPGDTVIQEDCKNGRLFVLKSGVVEVRKRNQALNRSASPGAVFGEVSALLNSAYSASVVALAIIFCDFNSSCSIASRALGCSPHCYNR